MNKIVQLSAVKASLTAEGFYDRLLSKRHSLATHPTSIIPIFQVFIKGEG